jgi:hypothetical protein
MGESLTMIRRTPEQFSNEDFSEVTDKKMNRMFSTFLQGAIL